MTKYLTYLFFTILSGQCFAKQQPIEILHFWKQESERQALDVIKNHYERDGKALVYTTSSSSVVSRRRAIERIVSGFPPAAILWHANNISLQDLAENDVIIDLNDVAERENWKAKIPQIILKTLTINGRILAVPTNLHGENWAWYNSKIYKELKLPLPSSWQQFIDQAIIIKAAGYQPIAIGNEPWQLRLLFNSILLSIDKRAYVDMAANPSEQTINNDPVRKSWKIFENLRNLGVHTNIRSWSDASSLLINNKAAVQFMGDWVYSELTNNGLVHGKDFECQLAPGTSAGYAIIADVFIFPRSTSTFVKSEQKSIASIFFNEAIQHDFSVKKGSIPANLKAPVDNLNPCSKMAMRILQDNSKQIPSHRLVAGELFNNIFDEALGKFWNNPKMTIEEGINRVLVEVKSVTLRKTTVSY